MQEHALNWHDPGALVLRRKDIAITSYTNKMKMCDINESSASKVLRITKINQGPAQCHSNLILCLQFHHPTWVPVDIMAVPFPNLHSANHLEGLKVLGRSAQHPILDQISSGPYSYLRSEPVCGASLTVSIYRHFYLCKIWLST